MTQRRRQADSPNQESGWAVRFHPPGRETLGQPFGGPLVLVNLNDRAARLEIGVDVRFAPPGAEDGRWLEPFPAKAYVVIGLRSGAGAHRPVSVRNGGWSVSLRLWHPGMREDEVHWKPDGTPTEPVVDIAIASLATLAFEIAAPQSNDRPSPVGAGTDVVGDDLAAVARLISRRVSSIRLARARDQSAGAVRPALRRVMDHIGENLDTALSLDDLATRAGISPYHLARVFRAEIGCSVGQYIRSERIEAARIMLHETDAPIAEIAFACGFSSQSHLTTTFRNVTGTTPGAYRRRTAPGGSMPAPPGPDAQGDAGRQRSS